MGLSPSDYRSDRSVLRVLLAISLAASLIVSLGGLTAPAAAGHDEATAGDVDDDGWLDENDNCPNDANADQADVDDDGVGDVCDADDTDGPAADPDGDGIPNSADECDNEAEDPDGYQDADGCPEPAPTVVPDLLVNVAEDASDHLAGDGVCDADPSTEGRQCTLRAAIEEANGSPGGDTVGLPDGSYLLDPSLGSIEITRNLIITAASAGTTIVDGGMETNVFAIGGSSVITVEITDLTITGGCCSDGAGIYNDNTDLTLRGVTLADNHSHDGSGGGLYNYGGEVSLDNVTFDGNHAYYYGGALYNDEGTVSGSSSVFSNNGFMAEEGVVTERTEYGGAVYNDQGNIALQSTSITGNQAYYGGAGIYSEQGTLSLDDVTVDGNSSDGDGYGVGIYTYTDDFTFTGGSVSSNTGGDSGGGIYSDYSTLDFTDVTVDDNQADYYGGMYVYEGGLTFTGGSISNNTAEYGDGGGLYNDYTSATLDGVAVNGNWADEEGGGIYNYETPLTLTNSTVNGNWAYYDGGGIYHEYGALRVVDSEIDNNFAGEEGAGLYKYDGVGTLIRTSVSGNGVDDDGDGYASYTYAGGGIYNDYELLTLKDSIVDGNFAESYGAGIYHYDTILELDGTTVSNNGAYDPSDPIEGDPTDPVYTDDGGGIYFDDDAVTLTDSTVDGNTAEYNGGGIYNYCCNLTLNRSTVSNNDVLDGYGGGIYNDYALKMTNSTVWGNDATYGGGIYNNGWDMKLLNVTVAGNHASTGTESSTPYGGGIYNDYNAVLEDTIVADNTAGEGESMVESNCAGSSTTSEGNNLDDDGSCLDGSGLGDLPDVTDPLLGGLADNGGPTETVALTGGSPAIDGGSCPPPVVDQRGEARPAGAACDIGAFELGAADVGAGPGALEVGVLDTDSSDADPGDGNCDYDTETIGDQCTLRAAIEEAEALDGGNTVVVPEGTVTLTDGELYVEHNLILSGAGAGVTVIDADGNDRIFNLDGPVTVEMVGLSLVGGSADYGAAIYNDAGRLTLSGVALNGNEAWDYGGALYNYQGEVTLSDVVMDGNYADYGGGALYNEEGTVTATGSDFTNNGFMAESDDTSNGGAIYNYYGILTLSGADVTGNQAEYGGGIYSEYGTVDLTDVMVEGNSALSEYSYSYSYYYCSGWWCPGQVSYGGEGTNGDGGGIYSYEDDLTFSGGSVTGNQAGDSGGGIYGDYSEMTMTDVDVDGNDASGSYHYWETYQNYPWYNYDNSGTSGDGAGIYAYEGSLGFSSGSISGNDAGAYGGGLYNDYATVTLTGATVAGNTAVEDGGGIYSYDALSVAGSSITGNQSGDDGGGIYHSEGTLDATSSAIDGNWAADEGAGLYKDDGVGTLTNTTVNGNGLPVADSEADLSPDGGGGIYNDDDVLNLVDSTVSGNFAESYGGGIYNEDERLTLLRTVVNDNGMSNPADPSADPHTEYGAGLYNEDFASIHDSTFDGNVAHYEGGGIYNTDELTVRGSTVSNNAVMALDGEGGGGRGGGVANHSYLFKVINSTVSANDAISGGGLYNSYNMTLVNATVADNHASESNGGIWNDGDTAVLEDTIVARNTSGFLGDASNCSEEGVTSEGHNLDDDGSCFGEDALADGTGHATDLVTESVMMGALADNGGPTMTHVLKAGSPAIDAAVCPPPYKDQRGIDRSVDGDLDGDAACDIGATEFGPSTLSIDDVSVLEGNSGTTAVTFTITRSGGDGAGSVDFSTNASSASPLDDFQAVSGTLSFAADEASQTVTVDVVGDELPEPDESFTVNLGNATFALIGDGSGLGTILDDGDVADEATATVGDGGTVQTGEGASPENPTSTSVTTPNGGTVTIAETQVTEPAPGGWSFFGQQVDITAPPADSPSDPLVIQFRVDASVIPAGASISSLAVFRNGVEAAATCPELAVATESSYPCVASRTVEIDGDFTFTVRTMQASAWNFGLQTGGGGGGNVVVRYSLSVLKAGTGDGLVESTPAGISCGTACAAGFVKDSLVTLTATPAEGSRFDGWSGPCTGTGSCVLSMTEAMSVTATFTDAPDVLGTVQAASVVRLAYVVKKSRLKATVTSSEDACVTDRRVIFKKRRDGKDRILGRRLTNARGIARLGGIENPSGVYYARVKTLETHPEGSDSMLTCGADRSNLLRLGKLS